MIQSRTGQELLELPYGARQCVVVVPDETLYPPAPGPLSVNRAQRIVRRVRERAPFVSSRPTVPHSPMLRALVELRQDGILLTPVPQTQAEGLGLPVGHPLPNVVYIGSPAARRYYPAADFHRRLFEHKFAEAIRLVMALGATRMVVEWERGWRKDLAAGMEAPLKKIAKGAGEFKASSDRQSSLLFEASLASGDPVLPEGLVWYEHEPTWQAVAEGRLERDLNNFTLTVRTTDDYGIDSGFEAKIRRKKLLSLGGAFTAHTDTSWRIEGEFGAVLPRAGWRGRRS